MSRRLVHLTAGLLVGTALLGGLPLRQPALAESPAAVCRLVGPPEWQQARIEWIGACADGLATGPGVAIVRVEGQPPENFFGNAVAGKPADGVIELPGGYRPVRYKDGASQPLDERNDIIAAFRIAAKAGREVSSRYRAAGNTKAARDYAEAAERLENQMD